MITVAASHLPVTEDSEEGYKDHEPPSTTLKSPWAIVCHDGNILYQGVERSVCSSRGSGFIHGVSDWRWQCLAVFSSKRCLIWGFPKSVVPFLGVPIIRIKVYWGQYWGPLFWESTIWAPA